MEPVTFRLVIVPQPTTLQRDTSTGVPTLKPSLKANDAIRDCKHYKYLAMPIAFEVLSPAIVMITAFWSTVRISIYICNAPHGVTSQRTVIFHVNGMEAMNLKFRTEQIWSDTESRGRIVYRRTDVAATVQICIRAVLGSSLYGDIGILTYVSKGFPEPLYSQYLVSS
jgi:hypothetical protein